MALNDYDVITTQPVKGDPANRIDEYIQRVAEYIQERFIDTNQGNVSIMYGFDSGETSQTPGIQWMPLVEQAGDPSNLANTMYLYSKDVAGETELFLRDSTNAAVQITSGGLLNTSAIPDSYLLNTGDTITGGLVFNTGASDDVTFTEDAATSNSAGTTTFNFNNAGGGGDFDLQVDGNSVLDSSDTLTADIVEIEYDSSEGDTSNDGTGNWQDKLTFTFTAVASDYIIEWSAELEKVMGLGDSECRAYYPTSALVMGEHHIDSGSQIINLVSGFYKINLGAGSRTFKIQFRNNPGSAAGNTKIRRARMKAYRVS